MPYPIGLLSHAGHLLAAGHQHTVSFHFSWSIKAFLALIAGILVLVRPKNVNLIVASYLIVLGLIEIMQIEF